MRNTDFSRLAGAVLVLFAAATGSIRPATAQEVVARGDTVDHVLAVVGDSVVLFSQILQAENQQLGRGQDLPPEGTPEREAFREALLESLIAQQIVLQAAQQDTLLEVDNDRVESVLQEQIAGIEEAFGSREAMEAALQEQGLTMQSYREQIRGQVRQQMLVELYVQRHQSEGAVEVTEAEVREAFEQGRSALEERPATVTFKQIMLRVDASDSTRNAARARADELLERVHAGEDFAALATEHSQDPGSAQAGGDLGWFRRGAMVAAFEDAAFSLLEGGISEVVETDFGFHIILVERIRFAERRARHILVTPEVGAGDVGRARARASEVVERALSEDFDELVAEHHDPSMPDSATVPQRRIAQMLAPAYVAALSGRVPGEIVGPVQFTYQNEEVFAIIKILELREAGEYSYEDLEPQIRASLMRSKQEQALLDGLRAKTYVRIREPS